jgi:hypothetical protein
MRTLATARLAEMTQRFGEKLTIRIRQVTSRGAQIPLTPVQLRDASRTTAPTEDELSHRRIAQLLGLPSPPPTTN